jgi:hypothetical protein
MRSLAIRFERLYNDEHKIAVHVIEIYPQEGEPHGCTICDLALGLYQRAFGRLTVLPKESHAAEYPRRCTAMIPWNGSTLFSAMLSNKDLRDGVYT